MKNIFSILLAFFILLSGMHLSVATHICGGEVASVKWSFSGEKATCGMEGDNSTDPANNTIASDCCHNYMAVYTVDGNYLPSSFEGKEFLQDISPIIYIPVSLLFHSFTSSNSVYTNPPGKLFTSTVSLAGICVFRI